MKTKLLIATLSLITLAGCGSWGNPVASLKPYRIEVQQGNLVTQDMLARLKPGMSPSQVRFVLGTPLIVDPFHAERWDYVYSLQQGDKVIERRRITVLFENDRLKGVEGDVTPAARTEEAKP
jgi:outer membrane protein assembly factor BamE